MNASSMVALLDAASRASRPPQTEPLLVHFATTVEPAAPWSREALEAQIDAKLPAAIVDLWSLARSVRLFEDVTYGQWGLVLVSPERSIELTERLLATRSLETRRGDVVVGEFIGDSELLLLRCDEGSDDYGAVAVVLPIYPRAEWPVVADSLGAFLPAYIAAGGDKFWEQLEDGATQP